jgi:hypothetical protein
MQKVDLKRVLEMLINEEQPKAEALLHRWFVEKTKVIHESLMQEDDVLEPDDLTKRLEDDQDQIKAEEYYGEDDDEDELEGGDDKEVDDLATDGATSDLDSDDGMSDDSGDGMPDDDGMTGDDGSESDIEGVKSQFDDLQSDLLRLKSEFEKIVGGDDNDMMPTDDPSMDDAMSGPSDDSDDMADPDGMDNDRMPPSPGGDEEEDEEKPFEDYDFTDLGESFELETVTPAKLTSPEYAGKGGKVPSTNNTSLIKGNNKPNDRFGAKPVKFGGEEKGNISTQNVPKVVNAPLRKNQVKSGNGYDEKVNATGPKNALLNTKQPGDEKTKNFFGGMKVSEGKRRR